MGNELSTHNIHEPLFTFAWDRAEHINLILFSEDGRQILAIKKGESFDVLRGTREWDDDTLEDVARREAHDQANATLDAVTICAVLSTPEILLSKVSYELVMTAFVTNKGPRAIWQETESIFVDKETFLARYAYEDQLSMRELIKRAEMYRVSTDVKKRKDRFISNQNINHS